MWWRNQQGGDFGYRRLMLVRRSFSVLRREIFRSLLPVKIFSFLGSSHSFISSMNLAGNKAQPKQTIVLTKQANAGRIIR